MFTIENRGDAPLHMQITSFGWDQRQDGTMALAPTDQVVVFPDIFSVAPRSSRHIRAAVVATPAATERTYRLFLEELPSIENADTAPAAQLAVRARVGIPIFLAPANAPSTATAIDAASVRDGILHFDVANTGNQHAFVKTVRVTGTNATGSDTFERSLPGWYVLAGGRRTFDLKLPGGACEATTTLRIDAGDGAARAFPLERDACVR